MTFGLVISLHQAIGQSFFVLSTNTVGSQPVAVIAADVNGDGWLDLVSANGATNILSVLTNSGTDFGSNATLNVGIAGFFARSVVAADINGDGKVDLICAISSGSPNYTGRLSVLTNNGGGIFSSNATLVVGSAPNSVIAADVNADGWPDLISANPGSLPFVAGTISVLTNNGAGIFGANATFTVGKGPHSIIAADVNNDGRLDLICANFYDNTLSIFTNKSSGGFGSYATPNVGSSPLSVVAVDINNDGKVDLISANSGNNTLTVLTNNGSGGFGFNATYTVGSIPYSITTADVNGDGMVDLISANTGNNTLTVLTNNRSGGFGYNATLNVGGAPYFVTAADANTDGRLDLISANWNDGTLSVLTNASTFLPLLTLKPSSYKMIVSWASQWTSRAGWILQQNTNLNTTNWTGFSGTIGDDGTTKTATNSSSVGNVFYRLAHP